MKNPETSEHKYTNALINESSPYLLQHAHNPVDWHPWNEESLAKAKAENKMLIISVGYAACHWCHVMEHESFEDTTVAEIMNKHFIPIKVDREERPDVDDVYMTACHLASGRSCGWPLNAFALADGRPVWAGTYFPKDQWINILNQFIKIKEQDPQKLEQTAAQLMGGIQNYESISINTGEVKFNEDTLHLIANDFMANIDFIEGGRKGSPKFPMPNNYEFLFHYHQMTGNPRALQAAELTLDKMAYGGLYDQLGGGFARYSTDAYWIAPHFEKMLYDNGQLLSLYAHGYQLTGKPLYKKVMDETIAFAKRELMSKEYGFYSSLDADSEKEEGKFYVFQKSEIDSIIGDEKKAAIFNTYYTISENGNWEHKNILLFNEKHDLLKKHNLSQEALDKIIDESKVKLMAYRDQRVRPATDDKILTGWNGLMLRGLVEAYKALGEKEHLDLALKNAQFILDKQMDKNFRLNRNYKDGKSSINAFLDDYASVIDAFIGLYQVTFDEKWLDRALSLTEYVRAHFKHEGNGMYNYTSDIDPPLIARKLELSDNVIPGSNSMMARNLFTLGTYLYKEEYVKEAQQMMKNIMPQITQTRQPNFYSNWCQLYAQLVVRPYEVAVLGDEANEVALQIQKNYLPQSLLLGGKSEGTMALLKDKLQEGQTTIYVCQNKVCKMPVTEVHKALELMK